MNPLVHKLPVKNLAKPEQIEGTTVGAFKIQKVLRQVKHNGRSHWLCAVKCIHCGTEYEKFQGFLKKNTVSCKACVNTSPKEAKKKMKASKLNKLPNFISMKLRTTYDFNTP